MLLFFSVCVLLLFLFGVRVCVVLILLLWGACVLILLFGVCVCCFSSSASSPKSSHLVCYLWASPPAAVTFN